MIECHDNLDSDEYKIPDKLKDYDLLLLGLVGSKAYGLDNAGSDNDYGGCYIEDLENAVNSLTYSDKSVVTKDPDGQVHELTKFINLCAVTNPTIFELLWLGEYIHLDFRITSLIEDRIKFISTKQVIDRYGGYAKGQLERYKKQSLDKRKPKHIRHCFRLFIQGIEMLEEGNLTVRLSDSNIDMVSSISELPLDKIEVKFNEFDDRLKLAASKSKWPDDKSLAVATARHHIFQARLAQAQEINYNKDKG